MADLLDRLEQEAASLPSKEKSWGWASLNPWFYRPKSQERFDADQRSAHVLARLSEQSPGAMAYQNLPADLARQVDAYEEDPSQWTSSYEPTAGSNPVYNAAMWAQSMPSAIYATGKMLGNAVDKAVYKAMTGDEERNDLHPEAYDQYRHSANTLTAGALDPTGPSYWKDVVNTRMAQERAPKIGYYPTSLLDQPIADAYHAGSQEIEDGRQFLERSGAHPYAAMAVGPLMDAGLSWPSSIGPATQALRAGKPLSALIDMGADVLMSNPNIPLNAAKKYSEGKLPWEE